MSSWKWRPFCFGLKVLSSPCTGKARQQMSKSCCAPELRCQFRTCATKIAPAKLRSQMRFQNAAAISKRSCDLHFAGEIFVSQVRFQNADASNLACFENDGLWFHIQTGNQTGNSLRGSFAANITNSEVYFFLPLINILSLYIYILYIYNHKHSIHSCAESRNCTYGSSKW